jgi:hypothetical protein
VGVIQEDHTAKAVSERTKVLLKRCAEKGVDEAIIKSLQDEFL